jgi:hypothetical protein
MSRNRKVLVLAEFPAWSQPKHRTKQAMAVSWANNVVRGKRSAKVSEDCRDIRYFLWKPTDLIVDDLIRLKYSREISSTVRREIGNQRTRKGLDAPSAGRPVTKRQVPGRKDGPRTQLAYDRGRRVCCSKRTRSGVVQLEALACGTPAGANCSLKSASVFGWGTVAELRQGLGIEQVPMSL